MQTKWDATNHVRSVLAELVFAEELFRIEASTEIYAPRHPLTDVMNEALHLDVDVKVAGQVPQDISGKGSEQCIEWRGSGRKEEAREGVTHYALVVLDDTSSLYFENADAPGEMKFSGTAKASAIYLVERELINGSRRVWNKSLGQEGSGVYLHLPLPVCEARLFPDCFTVDEDQGELMLNPPTPSLRPPKMLPRELLPRLLEAT